VHEAYAPYVLLDSVRQEGPAAFLWRQDEDVVADLRGAIVQVAEFLGLSLDGSSLDAAADTCSVERAVETCNSAREQLNSHIADLRAESPQGSRYLRAGHALRWRGRLRGVS
jgi:hypothetical protein